MRLKSTHQKFENKLFLNYKEILYFLAFLLLLGSINVSISYYNYLDFKSKNIQDIEAKVISQYIKTKNERSYFVLKLDSPHHGVFYTTSREDLKDITNRDLSLKGITKNVTFKDYISTFYVPSFLLKIGQNSPNAIDRFGQKIASMHEHEHTKELFLALFLAKPISKDLREQINLLGISHLIAISGFHLGVIVFVIFWLLIYPYRFLQQRYFSYRNSYFDITTIAIIFSFFYLYIVDFVPSLLRAFSMLFFGFLLYIRGVRILSFTFLLTVVLALLALKPSLVFSIGFILSVCGVFYIYLIIHHLKDRSNLEIFLAINSLLYFLMLPIVHFYFDPFSPYQILSIPLTVLFSAFYPLEIFLHLISFGGVLDSYILELISLPKSSIPLSISIYFLIFFLLLSIISIFSKKSFLLLICFSLIYWFKGLYKFTSIIGVG